MAGTTAGSPSGAGADGGSAADPSLREITREQGAVWWIFLREGEYREQGKSTYCILGLLLSSWRQDAEQ